MQKMKCTAPILKIKKYIIQQYVKKGLIKLIKPTYNKEEIHILTSAQWEVPDAPQKQKGRSDRMGRIIGIEGITAFFSFFPES